MKTNPDNKFNDFFQRIMENNSAGGLTSVFGDVTVPWGNKTENDARIPKVLGKVIKRNKPELTVFATGKKSKSKKKKKNAK
jgi:hypothetical protein